MGSPAASADVQPAGRRRFERRSQIAPEPAFQREPARSRAYSSYSRQASRSTITAWWSEPPSMRTFAGMGYGPAVRLVRVEERDAHALLGSGDDRDRDPDRRSFPEPGPEVGVERRVGADRADDLGRARRDGQPVDALVPRVRRREHGTAGRAGHPRAGRDREEPDRKGDDGERSHPGEENDLTF